MKYVLIAIIIFAVLSIASFIAGAKWLRIKRYSIESSKLKCREGLIRITFISDLHERCYGENNSKLIEHIGSTQPDIIIIGGDTVDTFGAVGGAYVPLFEALPDIAPTFMVMGNHEYSARRETELAGVAENAGIRLLEDSCAEIDIRGDVINIIGMDDYNRENIISNTMAERFDAVPVSDFNRRFNILVSHRPVEMNAIAERGIDLMLSGHMHGGQMRLPFVGGVFTPSSKRLFPKYDMGLFGIKNMDLIVSSGLGASTIPLRYMNRPEITVIDLTDK